MSGAEQAKNEKRANKTIIVLSVLLVLSVFLNVYQLFYIKQIEGSFEVLEQRYIELLEDIQSDSE